MSTFTFILYIAVTFPIAVVGFVTKLVITPLVVGYKMGQEFVDWMTE